MKVIYSSYRDVTTIFRGALSTAALGLGRSLWAVFLLIVNAAALAFRKVSAAIKRKPVTVVIVLLFILAVSNIAVYASMKARLTTAEWRYDRLQMHMDSVYEAYNIHRSYSRIVSYDNAD